MNVNVYVFDKQNNREPLVFNSHTVAGSSSVPRRARSKMRAYSNKFCQNDYYSRVTSYPLAKHNIPQHKLIKSNHNVNKINV